MVLDDVVLQFLLPLHINHCHHATASVALSSTEVLNYEQGILVVVIT
jgi:hypothetical protein